MLIDDLKTSGMFREIACLNLKGLKYHIYIYMCIYAHVYIHIYMYTYMYVYMCMHIMYIIWNYVRHCVICSKVGCMVSGWPFLILWNSRGAFKSFWENTEVVIKTIAILSLSKESYRYMLIPLQPDLKVNVIREHWIVNLFQSKITVTFTAGCS